VKSKSKCNDRKVAKQWDSEKAKATAGDILPELSKFFCHAGRAGGSPV
jgi:hypothetical protein